MPKTLLGLLVLLSAASSASSSSSSSSSSSPWAAPLQVLRDGVAAGAFPGCVGLVGRGNTVLFQTALGSYGYGDAPLPHGANREVEFSTRYDMASCSKVMGTTTLGALLYQRGYYTLDQRVSDFLGPAYAAGGKQDVRIVNCLTHDAGYPPDPVPGYWEEAFGCPQSSKEHPGEDFSCDNRIFASLMQQKLDRPPGVKYVYSDLSMITLQYVYGKIVRDNGLVNVGALMPACGTSLTCYFEAALRTLVFENLGMNNTQYLLPEREWGDIPPTRNDTHYRHAVSQGQVDDENAYALGGVAGHAGIFSNAEDIVKLVGAWLYGQRPELINATTARLWTTEYNHSISSRALGWNTNDPSVPDRGWDGTCGTLSAKTFLHIGYTGTQICADPERGVFTVLLTNRVYPSGANTKIQQVRREWNDAVVQALGA